MTSIETNNVEEPGRGKHQIFREDANHAGDKAEGYSPTGVAIFWQVDR